jgi:TonB-dependent receptor
MKKDQFKPSAVCLAVATVLGSAAPLVAQAQDDDAFEEIVVTGIRGSLTGAADIKRNSNGVVDAISAVDIGKFPDTNLAESLQRITGVSIDRSNGEGQQISVRGFGPGFNLVTLNGRQMPGAVSPKQEGADTNAQIRSFNFNEIAADAVSGVKVFKTARPYLPSGGIGATVDIITARPLQYDDFVLSGSIRANMDSSVEVGDDVTPEVTAIISNKWEFDGGSAFGAMFNGSYSERHSREEIVTSDGWQRNDINGANIIANIDTSAVDTSTNPGIIYTPRNLVTDQSDHERTRTNGQLVLQFGTENFEATADYTYSEYEDNIQRAQSAVWFDQNLVTGTANANGTVIDPTITSDQQFFGAMDFNSYTDVILTENESIGINLDWQVTDTLSLNLDAHDSSSHAQPNGESSDWLGIFAGPIGMNYTANFGTGSEVPTLSWNQVVGGDTFDPQALRPNIALQRGNEMENTITEINLRGAWENGSDGALQAIRFGVGTIEYQVDTNFLFQIDVYDGGITCGAACDDFVSTVPLTTGGSFSGGDTLPQLVNTYAVENMTEFLQTNFPNNPPVFLGPTQKTLNVIEEETVSAFVQFEFEDTFNGMPFGLVAGLRIEDTETTGTTLGNPPVSLTWISSTELRADTAAELTEISIDGAYTQLLPSVDANLEFVDDMIIRASWGQTMSRQNLNDLRGNLGIVDTRPQGPYLAFQGNPGLEPYLSDNLDLSYEWYYDEGSYFSLAYFKKWVDKYPVSSTRQGPILAPNGQPLTDPSTPGVNPPAPVTGGPGDPVAIFDISTLLNGEAAEVDGFEIAIQHLFDMGLGLQANATFVDGDVDFDPSQLDQAVALTGLSDSANFVAFYEGNNAQIRLAYNWRDEFLLATNQLRSFGEPVFVKEYGQWDFLASYTFAERYTVFFEGINITDEIAEARGRFDEQFIYAFHGGPRWSLGLRASF